MIVNIVPYLITRYASARPKAPVSKGTVRLLVGLGAFLITWIVWAFVVSDRTFGETTEGFAEGMALIVLYALCGLLAVHFFEVAIKLFDGFRGYSNLKNRRYFIEPLLDERQALLDALPATADSVSSHIDREG